MAETMGGFPPAPEQKTEQAEVQEQSSKQAVEIYIQTGKGAMRGELVESHGSERIIRTTWVRSGEGVGWFMKLDATALKAGEPLVFSVSMDGGTTWQVPQTSDNLELVGRWERGTPITLEDLKVGLQHAGSNQLPDNLEAAHAASSKEAALAFEAKYQNVISAYEYAEASTFSREHPEEAKFNFAINNNGNVGWKVHLNVTPENAPQVAEYLKQNGYDHKFLMGGGAEEGKVFTIYFGAKSMMDKWSPQLSRDLGTVLCKPLVNDEVEVSPGVVARFTSLQEGNKQFGEEFLQYGAFGMSARKKFMQEQAKKGIYDPNNPSIEEDVAKDAFQHLSEMYGSYFTG